MESGFDFSQFKWVVIFAIFVVYKFFSTKPKVEEITDEQHEEMLQEIERTLTGQFDQMEEQPQVTAPKSRAPKPKVVTEGKGSARNAITSSQIADGASNKIKAGESAIYGSDEIAKITDDFDLQKAVVMSEILNRKYDE